MSPSRPPSRGRPQGGGLDTKKTSISLCPPPASPHEGCRERCRSRPERCRQVAPELERPERHRSLPQRCRSRLPHVARDPPAHRTTSQHRSATHPATTSDVARPSSDIARDVGGGRLRHRTPAERHRSNDPQEYVMARLGPRRRGLTCVLASPQQTVPGQEKGRLAHCLFLNSVAEAVAVVAV